MRSSSLVVLAVVLCAALPGVAPAQAPLTVERFNDLAVVFDAFFSFHPDNASQADFGIRRSACRKLDDDDALLAPMRRACLAKVRFGETMAEFDRCDAYRRCRFVAPPARRAAAELIRGSRGRQRRREGGGAAARLRHAELRPRARASRYGR